MHILNFDHSVFEFVSDFDLPAQTSLFRLFQLH